MLIFHFLFLMSRFLLLWFFLGLERRGRLALLSRGDGWPFIGLKLGLALPSWGRGWRFLSGVGVVQL